MAKRITVRDLMICIETCNASLGFLRMAIEAGDPKNQLLLRVDDIIRWNKQATK